MERLALSWGKCPAVYETAAVAAEPHRRNGPAEPKLAQRKVEPACALRASARQPRSCKGCERRLVGRHGLAPCSIRVRAGASLSKFATRTRREGGVEPPQSGL